MVNYREAYGLYACNGILFKHESPHRGETFVTRKITRGLAHMAQGLDQHLYLGNLGAACQYVMELPRVEHATHTAPQRSHLNVGTGVDLTICELAETIEGWSATKDG